jgi:hypothetical protein
MDIEQQLKEALGVLNPIIMNLDKGIDEKLKDCTPEERKQAKEEIRKNPQYIKAMKELKKLKKEDFQV